MNEQKMAQDNLILKCMVGSNLYGTTTADSDKDYIGVFIPNKEYVLGLRTCEQVQYNTNSPSSGKHNSKNDIDTTYYSLIKFIKLCYENNPNILEVLFTDRKHIIYCNDYGKRLLEAFPFFVSKRVKHKFLGYAHSQRQKLINKKPIGTRVRYTEKYGFDTKFASHLIRLLSEGLSLLVEGRLSFPIDHNRYITAIKEGKYDMGQVLTKADQLEALVEQAYINSKVQHTPNFAEVQKLQISLLTDFWKNQETY